MAHDSLMQGMSVHHLRFTVQPTESIVFDAQAGSALRGALYQSLSENFCSEPGIPLSPDHTEHCPVCWLLAAEDPNASRGENIPRPLTVEPPVGDTLFHPSRSLAFGFSLIGKAQNLFPYLARAVERMGRIGVGKGRGRFRLTGISEYSPLLDAERPLLNGRVVSAPTLQVTTPRVMEAASTMPQARITLEFLTPLRLIKNEQLVKYPDPLTFLQRLLERCQGMVAYYADTPSSGIDTNARWAAELDQIKNAAAGIRIAYDDTQWAEAHSGSRRQGRYTPISGLVGTVRFEGDLSSVLPWFLWGASLHVGKNAVKGNGWYRIVR